MRRRVCVTKRAGRGGRQAGREGGRERERDDGIRRGTLQARGSDEGAPNCMVGREKKSE
jgi:hypothetical protein